MTKVNLPPDSHADNPRPLPDPHADYLQRHDLHQQELARFRAWESRLSNLRLVFFGLALAAGWFAFGSHQIDALWILPPLAVFLVLLGAHDRVIQWRVRAERAVAHYEAGLARLEDRWAGQGDSGERYLDVHHPYAIDLDLFGEGSLFELLCTARTPAGQATLASWLSQQADVAEVKARQRAVVDLAPRVDLRHDLALLGEDVGARLNPDALVAWGAAPVTLTTGLAIPILAGSLSGLSTLGLLAWFFSGAGPIPFVFALVLQMLLAVTMRARIKPVLDAVEKPTRGLVLLRELLARLEAETFSAERLIALRAVLETKGLPPSQSIARLQRLADLLDGRRNQFFAPIAGLFMWGTQFGLAIERWRASYGPALASWIEAAAEIEALAAISGYAHENPGHVMPEVREGEPMISGRALGHPLLPRDQCVCNHADLGSETRALIISGSNMSGKSTYLRTVGCNVLLALAGAPVRAESMTLTPLAIAGAIRLNDSLREGTSQFYAEIKRLRQVVGLCDGDLPVLFLLDEILHGTNSHDRCIGASAVVKELAERGALGLVTTHDLALARIADESGGKIRNVHFQDHLEDGRMAFDYQLHPGVVQKSNALELMRAVGLEV